MHNDNSRHLAPVIYVAESPEQAINYKWDSRSKALNKNLVVMESEEILRLGQGNEHFYLPYDLNPGDVLIRHPYNQGYILATEAEEVYLKESAEGIFSIARCLGATKISYKRIDIKEFTREVDTSNGIKYKAVDVNVKVKQEKEQKLLHKIAMTREFPKQEFTTKQFAKAKEIAHDRGFDSSPEIRSLLEARDPELGQPMTLQTVNVVMSSTLNKVLDIAFSLNVANIFNLNSNTRVATSKKVDVEIEWDIQFE